MSPTNANTPIRDAPNTTTRGESAVNQEGLNCKLVQRWICSPNSYPRCTSQWVIECHT